MIYVSLDGQAAEMGVQQGMFMHATIPDLWFTLSGSQTPSLIEAKIVDDGRVLIMQSQLSAWRSNGSGAHRPQAWIAADRTFERFFYWSHTAFLPRLDATRARTPTLQLRLPDTYSEFHDISQLALHIIRNA